MSVKLLTEYHLELLSSKGGCTGSSESAHVKMPHSWRSHVTAHLFNHFLYVNVQWSWSLVFTSLILCLCDNEGSIEKVPMNTEFLIWTFACCLLEPPFEIWVLISCAPSVRSKEQAHLSRLPRNCRICTEQIFKRECLTILDQQHTLSALTMKAMWRLRRFVIWFEPSLVVYEPIKLSHEILVPFLKASHECSFLDSVIITQISCTGSFA